MEITHSITSKGQITLPKEMREKLGLDKTRRANIRMNNQGQIVISRPKSLEEVRAILSQPTHKDALTDRERLVGPGLVKKHGLG